MFFIFVSLHISDMTLNTGVHADSRRCMRVVDIVAGSLATSSGVTTLVGACYVAFGVMASERQPSYCVKLGESHPQYEVTRQNIAFSDCYDLGDSLRIAQRDSM